ncbi:nodulin MtN21 /EamA-like transporter family protein [Euphorbia peplus]|nr:nodulin MtN21 /EamA-like transporter family protein [Euphorbia peplus]
MRFGGSLLPFIGMVVVIVAEVSSMEITKIALSHGINKYVIIVYSDALFLLITLPCSFIFDRSEWTPLTFSLISDFFFLALLGTGSQILAFVGLQYSSAKVGTSMLNLIPAFTFILAIIFRLEKVGRRSKSSAAKCIGTIVSIGGAFVVIFYTGPTLLMATPSPQLFWMIGAVSFAAEAFLSSSLYIMQTFVLKRFPTVITLGCCMGFFGIMMSTTFALMVVKDASA